MGDSRYIIGVMLGSGISHITIKYLGRLSSADVMKWRWKIDEVASGSSSFSTKPNEVSVFGRGPQKYLVDKLFVTDRMADLYNKFDVNLSDTTPHVTFKKLDYDIDYAGTHNKELIDRIQLIRIDGAANYTVEHTAMLQRRTLIDKIKDFLI